MLTKAHPRIIDRVPEVVDLRDWAGLKGDGLNNDQPIIQQAIDQVHAAGGGSLHVPSVDTSAGKFYLLADLPLWMRSHVTIVGDGPSSLIRNVDTSGDIRRAYCFNFGTSEAASVENAYTKYAIAEGGRGDKAVTCNIAAEAAKFSSGDLACVMTGRHMVQFSVPVYENYLLTRVVSSNATTGVIELEEALNADYVTSSGGKPPQIYNLNQPDTAYEFGQVLHGVQRAGLRNLAIHSDQGLPVGDRGGALECSFDRLWTYGWTSPFGGNLYARCLITNIFARVRSRGLEVKMGSHDLIFRNIHMFYDQATGTGGGPGIDFGEGCRDVLVDGWIVDYGNFTNGNHGIVFRQCKSCRVQNGQLRMPKAAAGLGAVVFEGVGNPDLPACQDNAFTNNLVQADGAPRYWWFIGADRTTYAGNRLEQNTFRGTLSGNKEAGRIDGERNIVRDNDHEDGKLFFNEPTSQHNLIHGNYFPLATQYWASAANLTRNQIKGNAFGSGRPENSDDAMLDLTADATLGGFQTGLSINNEGATSIVTTTLPPAKQGMIFRFYRKNPTHALRIDPDDTEVIFGGGIGKHLSLDSDGAFVELRCIDFGEWLIWMSNGAISFEP